MEQIDEKIRGMQKMKKKLESAEKAKRQKLEKKAAMIFGKYYLRRIEADKMFQYALAQDVLLSKKDREFLAEFFGLDISQYNNFMELHRLTVLLEKNWLNIKGKKLEELNMLYEPYDIFFAEILGAEGAYLYVNVGSTIVSSDNSSALSIDPHGDFIDKILTENIYEKTREILEGK